MEIRNAHMGEPANGRRLPTTGPREPPNYGTAATGLSGPGKGPLVLAQARAPAVMPGQCPQTTGCSRKKPASSAAGSDKPMMDSKKQTLVSPGGEKAGKGKWGASRLSRLSDTFREV